MNYLSNTISNGNLLGINENNNIHTFNNALGFLKSIFKR